MCKVTIKEVRKSVGPKSGVKDGKPWKLWIFECLVSVDGSAEEAVRTCKTFDEGIASSTLAGQTFEAKKEGDSAPYSFLLQPEKKAGRAAGFRQQGPRESNRQTALRYAVELERGRSVQSGEIPETKQILSTADQFLKWLEGGE